ncbi:MAG: hypothetical protein KDJ77_15415, partial [Rhodobiaceae bacterium]|nr:hypothetical protein [Rhodobiaceae bacterium]
QSGQKLDQVCAANSVAAADLLDDNIDRLVTALFEGPLTIPQFAHVKHNETLNAFAKRVSVSASDLLTRWHNAETVIVPAETNLAITPTTGAIAAGLSLADYAVTSRCGVGDIARANAATPDLIADNLTLVVGGVGVTTSSSTFETLVTDFANVGITTTVESIAVASQNVSGVFNAGGSVTTYVVDRRLTDQSETIGKTVTDIFAGDTQGFITLNGDLPGLIEQNSRMQTGTASQPVPAGESLRRYLAHLAGLTVADFAAANGDSVMTTGSILLVPAVLDPTPLAAVPYGIQPGKTWQQIADAFAVSVDTLGLQDQNIPGIFVPGQTVTVPGSGSVVVGAGNSMASVIARFPVGQQPTLNALIAAIKDQTGLMLPGAALVCPVPLASATGTGAALSLRTIAGRLLSASDADVLRLAKANAALNGFLKQGVTFTVASHTFTVGPSQTMANSLTPVNAVLDVPLAYDAFLLAVADQDIVDPASKVLLPPPPVVFGADLPAAPAVAATLTQLVASVELTRPTGEIAASFAGIPEVQRAESPVPPSSNGVPATLADFAASLGGAYGGALWAATGPAERTLTTPGNQRQYAVRFDAPNPTPAEPAIRKVELGGGAKAPSYLALPPLANALVSRSADLRPYQSGGTPPFGTAEPTLFQAVDVMDWAVDFLATLDMVLSPNYAAAAYELTATPSGGSVTFDALVAAKKALAAKIAAQLTPIETGDSALDLAGAQALVEQELRQNLSQGFATDAVVQVPTSVEATFASTGADTGGHRLNGKTGTPGKSLSISTKLQDLATEFSISVEGVVELMAATPNILATGTTLTLGAQSWTIGAHDTLATGIAALATTPAAFAAAFAGQAPLFRDGILVTIDGFGADVAFGATLTTMADALDVSLRYVAVANQDLAGLLTGTVYLDGVPVTITPQTSSLSGLASAQSMSVETLAGKIAEQAVLATTATMHIARWVPEYSLTPGKIDLVTGDGALSLLLTVKERAHYRRLFLNLSFDITSLEYAIEPAAYVDGYETSKWLHFIQPLPATSAQLGGAVVDTDIGQLDIPIPLRAYPATPRLTNQRAAATYKPSDIPPQAPIDDRIAKAKAWSYSAGFELRLAAQDTAEITIGLNFAPPVGTELFIGGAPDPFAALAEFAANAAAITADLQTLVSGSGGGAPGLSAVLAIADIAGKVAENWGFVSNDGQGGGGPVDDLVPEESYGFRMQKRTRPGPDGKQLLDAIVLIRTASTASWGPGSRIPSLAYVDEEGVVRPLVPQNPGGTPQDIFYDFQQDVPDRGKLTYVIGYDGLDSVAYQNARASISILRNQS